MKYVIYFYLFTSSVYAQICINIGLPSQPPVPSGVMCVQPETGMCGNCSGTRTSPSEGLRSSPNSPPGDSQRYGSSRIPGWQNGGGSGPEHGDRQLGPQWGHGGNNPAIRDFINKYEKMVADSRLEYLENLRQIPTIGGGVPGASWPQGAEGDEFSKLLNHKQALILPNLVSQGDVEKQLRANFPPQLHPLAAYNRFADLYDQVRIAEFQRYQELETFGKQDTQKMIDDAQRNIRNHPVSKLEPDIYLNADNPVAPNEQSLLPIFLKLLGAHANSQAQKNAQTIGYQAVTAADHAYAAGKSWQADDFKKIAGTMAEIALGFVPGVGEGQSIYEAITGESLINGDKLNFNQRALAFAGIVTLGLAPSVFKLGKWAFREKELFQDIAKAIEKSHGDIAIHEFYSAEEMNLMWLKKHPSAEGPFQAYSYGIRGETKQTINATRASGVLDNVVGDWVTKENIANKSPQEIQRALSLPNVPTHLTDVQIPKGIEIIESHTSPIFNGEGGVNQIQIIKPDGNWFSNTREIK
jgi:hypothetical protein